MENNIAKANLYSKEKYGYSFIFLLMAKANGNAKNVLEDIGSATELLTIYAIVDAVAANGNGGN